MRDLENPFDEGIFPEENNNGQSDERKEEIKKSIILAVLTFITTTFVGALFEGKNVLQEPFLIVHGIPYSITLMLILGSHEMGHYMMAKRLGIKATPPFFIPVPFFPGTFGAFIKIKDPIASRKHLLYIGISGPFVGFIFSTIALYIGLKLSTIVTVANQGPVGLSLGEPMALKILAKITIGPVPEGKDVMLHPVAFAGWIGYLITALNLLPIGQLDGGHVFTSISPGLSVIVSRLSIVILIVTGIRFWPGWLVWAALNLLLGYKHPPVSPIERLSLKDKLVAGLGLLTLILCYTPAPIIT